MRLIDNLTKNYALPIAAAGVMAFSYSTKADDIKLGELIRKKTDPLAIFLTSTDHNSFIMMWAVRPILMGYTAWVENYGFPYQQRWEDINAMYAGGINAKNLFKKYFNG